MPGQCALQGSASRQCAQQKPGPSAYGQQQICHLHIQPACNTMQVVTGDEPQQPYHVQSQQAVIWHKCKHCINVVCSNGVLHAGALRRAVPACRCKSYGGAAGCVHGQRMVNDDFLHYTSEGKLILQTTVAYKLPGPSLPTLCTECSRNLCFLT